MQALASAAALVLAFALTCAVRPASAQTADDVVERAVAARGGADRIKAMHSQRLSGKIAYDGDAPGPFMVEMERPGRMREQVTRQGTTVVRTTDGKSGWVLDPSSRSSEAHPIDGDELKSMAGSADFEGPLVDYKAKGNSVALEGKEHVDGHDAFKLKITLPDSSVRYDYIDSRTFLEVRRDETVRRNGQDVVVESHFREYRSVNGVMVPFDIESGAQGSRHKRRILLDDVDINAHIADADFGKPPRARPSPPPTPADTATR
ncbi:MAG TPA: hypothetical protein VFW66_07985 [Gemmatimonadales bacterium]|nr:hypothetical protein [Gemmatimonadales bacterium]